MTDRSILHTVSEMALKLRIGVHTPTQHTDVLTLVDLWRRADELGFDWISVWDHFQPLDVPGRSLDAVAAHTLLASVTRSAQVGCLVYCASYHNVGSLALAATTIDHVSDGRAVIGLGAGYLEAEYRRFGIRFDPPCDRVKRLESTFVAMRSLLGGENVTCSDEFVTLNDARIDPRPIRSHLPLWIGGGGEQRTLPLAGRLADGWNVPMATADAFERKNAIVTASAIDAGRNPASIVRSVNLGLCFDERELPQRFGPRWEQLAPSILTGSDDHIIDMLSAYAAAGADQVNLSLRPPIDVADLERFAAELLPALK